MSACGARLRHADVPCECRLIGEDRKWPDYVRTTRMTRRRHPGRFSRAVLKFDLRTFCKPGYGNSRPLRFSSKEDFRYGGRSDAGSQL
jgi:hypothetical protein